MAVRVLDCNGSGSWSGVIAGIDWVAVNHAGEPAVANMSLGGGASTAVDTAVKNAIASGVTFAVAAGNSTRTPAASHPPACPTRSPSAPRRTPTPRLPTRTSARAWTCGPPARHHLCLEQQRHRRRTPSAARRWRPPTSQAWPHSGSAANPGRPRGGGQDARERGHGESRHHSRQEVLRHPEPAALHELLTTPCVSAAAARTEGIGDRQPGPYTCATCGWGRSKTTVIPPHRHRA